MKINNIILIFLFFGNTILYAQSYYPDGLLLKNEKNGAIYLVLGREKRHIKNQDVFNALFKDWNSIKVCNELELDILPTGKAIKSAMLCKGNNDSVFLVINNRKKHISSVDVFNQFYFDWNKIKTITDVELRKYKTENPIEKVDIQTKEKNIQYEKPCGVK